MDTTMVMYARYTARADASVASLLDKLSNDELNADRGSYYKSLGGVFAHAVGGTTYFLGLFKDVAPAAAATALASLAGLSCHEGERHTPAQWAELKSYAAAADAAMLKFIESLGEKELAAPVKIDWFDGKPDAVPLAYLLHCSFVHGTHHRGQISQILDSMGIEHDFSGLDLEFFPR
jgi:uncharacterized damage-inducible protein DinB